MLGDSLKLANQFHIRNCWFLDSLDLSGVACPVNSEQTNFYFMLNYLIRLLNPNAVVHSQISSAVDLVEEITVTSEQFAELLVINLKINSNKKSDLEIEMMGFLMFVFDAHASVMGLNGWLKVVMRLLGGKLGRVRLPAGTNSLEMIVDGEARIYDRVSLYKKYFLSLSEKDEAINLFIKLIALIEIRRSYSLPIFRGYLFPLEKLLDELRERSPIKNCGHWPDSARDEYVKEIALGNWEVFNIKSSRFLTKCKYLPDPKEFLDRVIETAAMLSSPNSSLYSNYRIDLNAVKLAIRSRHLLRPAP